MIMILAFSFLDWNDFFSKFGPKIKNFVSSLRLRLTEIC